MNPPETERDNPTSEISDAEILELPFTASDNGDAKMEADVSTTEPPNNPMMPPSADKPTIGDALSEVSGGAVEPEKEEQATPSADKPVPGVASFSIDDSPLTIPEALAYLQSAGFELKERTLQRYCQGGTYDVVCEKISTAIGQEWHVSQNSLDRFVKENPNHQSRERQATPSADTPATGDAKPEAVIPELSEEPAKQTTDTPPSSVASDDSRYEDQKDQVVFLRGQIKVKDEQIATLLERDRETNALIQGLQNMVLQLQAPKTNVHPVVVDRGGGTPDTDVV